MNEAQSNFMSRMSNTIDLWLGQLNHLEIVVASYLISTLVIATLIATILWDSQTQKRKLSTLEAQGIKRRSQQSQNGDNPDV